MGANRVVVQGPPNEEDYLNGEKETGHRFTEGREPEMIPLYKTRTLEQFSSNLHPSQLHEEGTRKPIPERLKKPCYLSYCIQISYPVKD